MVGRPCNLDNDRAIFNRTDQITIVGRQKNGRHTDRPKKDLIFTPPHFKKRKKEKKPTLNFLSRFLPHASFSTFAG